MPKTVDVYDIETLDNDDLAKQAQRLFDEFYDAYRPYFDNMNENLKVYRMKDWEVAGVTDSSDPVPTIPSLHAAVEGAVADRMAGYPECIVLPQTSQHEQQATTIKQAVDHVLELGDHKDEYRKQIYDSCIFGYFVSEIGWDISVHNGDGEAYMRRLDPRTFMADPQAEDIQQGRACFKFYERSESYVKSHYPKDFERMKPNTKVETDDDNPVELDSEIKNYLHLEYWYRKYDSVTDAYSIHMAVIVGGVTVEKSEDVLPDGYFPHGLYPFVLQPLYPIVGTPFGFGMVDALRNPQMHINKLNSIIMRNALISSRRKVLVGKQANVDLDKLSDLSIEFVDCDNPSLIQDIRVAAIPSDIVAMRNQMLMEIKDYSGVNDVSRGQTGAGITAASAIMALQEAAGKRTRLAETGDHGAYIRSVRQLIEVIRDRYTSARTLLIQEDDGGYTDAIIDPQMTFYAEPPIYAEDASIAYDGVPIEFKVSNKVQRQSVYQTTYYNELAVQLLQLGVINPIEALDMMHFEGVDAIKTKVGERHDLEAQMQQMMQQMEQMGAELAQYKQQEEQAVLQDIQNLDNMVPPTIKGRDSNAML